MIHAYASIWRRLKSAHKGGNGNNCQAVYREYMKGEKGVWGALAPQKPIITQTCPCNILQYFTAVKMIIFR